MIRLVDYGVGNTQAFMTLFKRMGMSVERATTVDALNNSTHLILPGVGHFDNAMAKLNNSGLRSKLEELVLDKKLPLIGVCVGMQMLADGSEEGYLSGLGWVPGHVRAFSNNHLTENLPMPHMGWNTLKPVAGSKLFLNGFEEEPQFYFLHSYYFDAQHKEDVAASAYYGVNFDAAVSRGNIHGIQCHPEKSHHWGAQLLKNFAEI